MLKAFIVQNRIIHPIPRNVGTSMVVSTQLAGIMFIPKACALAPALVYVSAGICWIGHLTENLPH